MAKDTMTRRERGVYLRKGILKYQWQLKVPKDLRSLYPTTWAVQCSLNTPNIEEANRKARKLRVQWDATFERQRQQKLNPAPDKVQHITPEIAQALADWCKRAVLSVDEGVRTNPRAWAPMGGRKALLRGMPEELADRLREENLEQKELMAQAVARSRLSEVEQIMGNAAADLGLELNDGAEGFEDALRACLFAVKEAYTLRVQRDEGVRVETPPAPSLKQIEAQKPRKLRDVFDLWKKLHTRDNVTKKNAALKLYEQHTGNPPLTELTRGMGASFKTWLVTKDDDAPKTKSDRLDHVKVLLNHAVDELGWLEKNPWKGLDIPYVTVNKRRPWKDAELKAFFGLPLFTAYALPKTTTKNGGAAAYWMPLLGLYTGARVGELAQLRVADVHDSERVHVVSINAKAEGSKVKSEAGVRLLPLHPELIRLGFLEYVEAMRRAGEERLWPALKIDSTRPGTYFSNWFSEAVKKVIAEDAPTFHYFRHGVRTMLVRKGAAESLINAIMGHRQTGVGSQVYTDYAPDMLLDTVKRLEYSAPSLPKVYRASAKQPEVSGAAALVKFSYHTTHKSQETT